MVFCLAVAIVVAFAGFTALWFSPHEQVWWIQRLQITKTEGVVLLSYGIIVFPLWLIIGRKELRVRWHSKHTTDNK